MPTLAKDDARDAAATNDITRRLAAMYADQHAESYVAEVVGAAYRTLAGARVRNFLPILVERLARERLGSRHHE